MTPRYPGRVRRANSIWICRRFSCSNLMVSSCPIMRRNTWHMSRSGKDTSTGPKSEGDGIVGIVETSFLRLGLLRFSVQGDDVIGVDFGGGALVPVPVLPIAGAQRPFDECAAALVQDSRELLRGLLPEDHSVPLRALLLLAAAIGPRFGGRHAEGKDGISLRGESKLWVGAEAAKQHDFVDADAHPSTSYSAMVRLVETWTPPLSRRSSSACFSTCLSFSPVFFAYSRRASRRLVFVTETSAAASATSSPKCARRMGSAFSPTMLSRVRSTGPSIRLLPSGIGAFSASALICFITRSRTIWTSTILWYARAAFSGVMSSANLRSRSSGAAAACRTRATCAGQAWNAGQ